MTAEERIRKMIAECSKGLDPHAKSRWRHGYADGLKDALKMIEEERKGKR